MTVAALNLINEKIKSDGNSKYFDKIQATKARGVTLLSRETVFDVKPKFEASPFSYLPAVKKTGQFRSFSVVDERSPSNALYPSATRYTLPDLQRSPGNCTFNKYSPQNIWPHNDNPGPGEYTNDYGSTRQLKSTVNTNLASRNKEQNPSPAPNQYQHVAALKMKGSCFNRSSRSQIPKTQLYSADLACSPGPCTSKINYHQLKDGFSPVMISEPHSLTVTASSPSMRDTRAGSSFIGIGVRYPK